MSVDRARPVGGVPHHGEVLHAFLDESYFKNDVHIVGALVLTSDQIHVVDTALNDIIWETSRVHPQVPLDIEFHGQNLFQRHQDWTCLRNPVDQPKLAFAIYRRALSRIVQAGGIWIIGGIQQIDRLARRGYPEPWPPHQIALQFTLERVHDYAASVGEQVRIVCDEVPDQAHHEQRMQQFRLAGRTPGWEPRTLSTIEPDWTWTDSRHHRSLQAIDMLTYVYLRKRFVPGGDERVKAEVVKMRDIIHPHLHREKIWTP
ncbi:DUF3800 domain-containing protein [Rathayibacter sp. Leaf248]|uniref:DUF3800 domain-containing protein n=1 Tax=Rathayibacter sp. Leaf248 TaxID=2876555 RepID=UPI001E439DBB|nr:DUF3800 domain-containing protein [Rathayibacter sp. Leaf248]